MLQELTYRVAWLEARALRSAYRSMLPSVVQRPLAPPRSLGLCVFSFSGRRDLPEQIASLRTFVRYAGRPQSFTVISDGSHCDEGLELLRRADPCVEVVHWQKVLRQGLPRSVQEYAESDPMGKKLAVELSLTVAGPTIYVDADVIFFPGAGELRRLERRDESRSPRYLRDCGAYLDDRVLACSDRARDPVNGGFFVLFQALDWSSALARLAWLQGAPNFFTEQTLLHLAMHSNKACPLDPQRYVVADDDRHCYRDGYAKPGLVLRHYTTTVRHQFWRTLARARGWRRARHTFRV